MQIWLHQILDAQVASESAAGIAGLIGNCSVCEALAQAKPRFRCISIDQLQMQDFSSSPVGGISVTNNLFARARNCSLGFCDAFVSHSWHDDPLTKWDVLQEWRSRFISSHQREPRIWFDK